ncbi:MAG: hypothetical protein ACP5EP_12255 [Acidobacteriaceae bacterium]
MDENIITWNVANWLTIVLMGAIGFFLFGAAQKIWQDKTGGQ